MYRGDPFIIWGISPVPYSKKLGRTSRKNSLYFMLVGIYLIHFNFDIELVDRTDHSTQGCPELHVTADCDTVSFLVSPGPGPVSVAGAKFSPKTGNQSIQHIVDLGQAGCLRPVH